MCVVSCRVVVCGVLGVVCRVSRVACVVCCADTQVESFGLAGVVAGLVDMLVSSISPPPSEGPPAREASESPLADTGSWDSGSSFFRRRFAGVALSPFLPAAGFFEVGGLTEERATLFRFRPPAAGVLAAPSSTSEPAPSSSSSSRLCRF